MKVLESGILVDVISLGFLDCSVDLWEARLYPTKAKISVGENKRDLQKSEN